MFCNDCPPKATHTKFALIIAVSVAFMRSDKKYLIEQKKIFFLKYLLKISGTFNFCLLKGKGTNAHLLSHPHAQPGMHVHFFFLPNCFISGKSSFLTGKVSLN